MSPLTRAARALGLLGVEAASIGLAAWIAFSRAVLPGYVRDNDLEPGQRRFVLIDMAVAVAVAGVVVGGIFVWKRRDGLPVLTRLARRASPLAVVWLVLLVFDRRLWDGRGQLFFTLVVGLGWSLAAALRTAWDTEPAFPRLASLRAEWTVRVRARFASVFVALGRPVVPLVVVILAAAAYGIYFSVFTIVIHENLGTHAFDLGIEDNLMWHVVHPGIPLFRSTPFSANPNVTHFGNHATWFSYVIAPLYALAPHPETLLVLQAVLLGAAAVPLYLHASRHLPQWTAALVACAYLVYPPLHGANLYEFHYLPLGIGFLWLALYAVEAHHRALAAVAVVLSLSVREDVAACLAVVGLYLWLTGVAARAGVVLAGIGGGYFLLMKFLLMPWLGGADAQFVQQYAGLLPKDDSGFVGVLKTLVVNPVFTAKVVFERDKLTYLLELFAPLLFLPLTRPVGLLLIGPGLVFTLLSTGYWPLYQPSFQYTSYWTAFVFIGVVHSLEHAGKAHDSGDDGGLLRRRSLALGLAAASLACTYLDGAILHRENVRAGFDRVSFRTMAEDRKKRADLDALIRRIPPRDKVVASDRLLPHVSSRDDAYRLAQGIFDADWLLFEAGIGGEERDHVLEALRDGTLGVLEDRGTMALAQRGAPPVNNLSLIARYFP